MKLYWYRLFNLSVFSILFFISCKGKDAHSSIDDSSKLLMKAMEAKSFVEENGYNRDFCFLLDFSIPSGKKRFFIWDFKSQTIIKEFLVTHGTCDGPTVPAEMRKGVQFSNLVDSHCSSEGKYILGKRDYSSWGIRVKYWMHGLEASNDNAVNRVVVLHSWESVPDKEVYPLSIVRSWGCPAVSNDAMWALDAMLQQQDLPTLLWIYV